MSVEDKLYPLLSAYERLPAGVKHGIGRTYRALPERTRLGAHFGEYRRLASEVEGWSADAVGDYQVRELRRVLSHAATYSPFYARRFAEAGFDPARLQAPGDLAACPTITGADLVSDLADMVCALPSKRDRLYMTTGGSTGTPVGFYLHKGVSRPKEQAFLEGQWRRGGYTEGARLAVIRGHVTTDRAHGRISSYDATRDWLMLSSYHLTEDRLPEYLERITDFAPDILHAYPSAALQLAEFLERTGERWPVPLRCVLAGSERLTSPQKRVLERVFGCRVYTWYGHSERVVLAGEGRSSEYFYFWPTYGFVEFGPPDDQGLCEVVGTSFHNLAMPLIRYRTGDYVRVHDPRVDGPKEFDWPAATAIEGRAQELLVTATGRKISLTAFNMHDGSFDGLYGLQFFQEEPGRAELRYVAGPDWDRSRAATIEAVVRRKLGDDLDVVLREVDQLEKTARGKGRWLVTAGEMSARS